MDPTFNAEVARLQQEKAAADDKRQREAQEKAAADEAKRQQELRDKLPAEHAAREVIVHHCPVR